MSNSQNNKNEQQNNLRTTLTEQWKHGKLKEGWYYYKASDGRNDIATEYGLYCVEADNNVELEVLAPVPSYEEWQELSKQRNQLIRDVKDLAYIQEENQQLKELLKECLNDVNHIISKVHLCKELLDLKNKIDNAIGEKK